MKRADVERLKFIHNFQTACFIPLVRQRNYKYMETLIKTQEHLDRLVNNVAMYGNIYYDKDMNFNPINWDVEFIKMIDNNRHVTLERVLYVA